MKTLSLVFFSILLLGCSPQILYEARPEIIPTLIPGSCYFSVIDDDGTENVKIEKSYLLEIIPSEYEKVKIKYDKSELKKFKIEDNKYHIPIQQIGLKFMLKNTDLTNFTIVESPKRYTFCLVENPTQWKLFTEEELIKADYEIEEYKLIRTSKILKKNKRKKPRSLKANQYFVEKGNWTKIKQTIAGGCGGGLSFQVRLEIKLIRLGYDVEVDDKMDVWDEDAIMDFQKKNGLKQGDIRPGWVDPETLIQLGVGY